MPSIQSQKGDVDDYATGRLVGNAISVAVGVAEVIAGDAGMAAGAAITASGAGAVIGVPLAVASAGVAAHGVATTASAAVNLGKDANSMKSQSNGKGGQTYNGRQTDQYGNVLGGSGKPRVNKTDNPTRKKAIDAAREGGKGKPIKHPSPKKGSKHYHSTDENGEKLPNSTHHNY